MKREIKFRAKSLDGELIYFELHESNISGDSEVFYVNDIPCESGTEQEYTGLKDKNGKEIYEGDIVKFSDIYNEKIVFEDGAFRAYTIEHSGKRSRECILVGGIAGLFKIIGNIYENPELLKS